jgi:hypothetical protein
MTAYVRFNALGQYLTRGDAPDYSLEADPLIFTGEVDVFNCYHDIATNLPVAFPPKPSSFHTFDYTTKQWIDPRTNETQWAVVRIERNKLLAGSDWTQMPDAPEPNKAAWATYRQALRDITGQADPFNIVWPVSL